MTRPVVVDTLPTVLVDPVEENVAHKMRPLAPGDEARHLDCPACHGDDIPSGYVCATCDGSGEVRGPIDRIVPRFDVRRTGRVEDVVTGRPAGHVIYPVDDWTPDHAD